MITDEQLVADSQEICKHLCAARLIAAQDKDDIQQTIYVALLKARLSFDEAKGSWRQYANYKARFAVQDFFRDSPRIGLAWNKHESEVRWIASLDDIIFEPECEQVYEGLELDESLEGLTRRTKQIIFLLLAGYSQAEISSLLGIESWSITKILVRLRIKNSPFSSLRHTDIQQQKRAA